MDTDAPRRGKRASNARRRGSCGLIGMLLGGCATTTDPATLDAADRASDDDATASETDPVAPTLGDASSFAALPCSRDRDDLELPDAEGDWRIEIGVTDRETETRYLSLEEHCGVPIAGIGQAGLLARLALRVRADLPRASIEMRVSNPADADRVPGVNLDAEQPRELVCAGDGFCYAVPVHVEISHLNRLPDLEGTLVRLDARVTDASTSETGTAHAWGVLEGAQ